MAYEDRSAGRPDWRERDRERNHDRGYGRDRDDRDPGAHADYYRGGDRSQRRFGPEGGFESRGDYRRSDRHAEQGQSDGRDDGGARSGYGGTGGAGNGFGYAAGGPRFDRQDVGSIGTHGAHPVASPFGDPGAGYAGGDGGDISSAREQAIVDYARQGQSQSRGQRQGGNDRFGHDPHYSDWRRRQIETFDRDYDEYRQENAARFESEFASWRETRGQQRSAMGRVTEHMDVVGSDDQHVGTVDKVSNGRVVLTRSDPSAGGHHHSIPCGWLQSVDDKVKLNKTAEEAMQAWRDEEASRALFESPDSGSDGPHILERSFSGTYRDER